MHAHRTHFPLLLVFGLLASVAAQAQSNAPLTGTMSGAGSAPMLPATPLPERPIVQQLQTPMPQQAEAPALASQEATRAEAFGDVTRGLLAAQADGRRAGGTLPVLGPVSTAAWTRYVNSFKTPIPDWFQKRVEVQSTN